MGNDEDVSCADSDSDDNSNCENDEVNYEDYIIFQHDSDSSDEDLNFQNNDLPETVQSDETDFNINISSNQILNASLDRKELIVLLFGMLRKVKSYLNNLTEEKHKEWLMEKVDLMKTVVFKEFQLFRSKDKAVYPQSNNSRPTSVSPKTSLSEPVNNISDSQENSNKFQKSSPLKALKTKPSKSPSSKEKNQKVSNFKQKSKPQLNSSQSKNVSKTKKKDSKTSTMRKLAPKKDCNTDRQDEANSAHEITNNKVKLNKNLGNRRVSQRLQEIRQGTELVYCDKLAYVSLNLPSTSTTSLTPAQNPNMKRKYIKKTEEEKNKIKEEKLSKTLTVSASNKKEKKKLTKSLTDSEQTINLNLTEANAKPKRGRPKTKGVETGGLENHPIPTVSVVDFNKEKNNPLDKIVNEINVKSKSKKRRAPSLEPCFQKKAKFNVNKRNSYAGSSTSDKSISMKKKLYSPGKWLLSFQKECEEAGI